MIKKVYLIIFIILSLLVYVSASIYRDFDTKQATLTSASLAKLNKAIRKWNKRSYRVKILQRGFQSGVQWDYK